MNFDNLASFGVMEIRPRGGFPRFNPEQVGKIWADGIIAVAGSRLPNVQDNDRLYPTANELREKGIDVEKLAVCISEGLIDNAEFGATIESLSVEQLNVALDHLLEGCEAFQKHPDPIDRAMHYRGCCSCHGH